MNKTLRDIVFGAGAAAIITTGYCGLQNYERTRDEQRIKATIEAKLQEEENKAQDLLNKVKTGEITLYRVIIPKERETGFGVDHIYYSETAALKNAPGRDTFRRVFELLNYDTTLAAGRAYYIPDMDGSKTVLGMSTEHNPDYMSQSSYAKAIEVKKTKEERDQELQVKF